MSRNSMHSSGGPHGRGGDGELVTATIEHHKIGMNYYLNTLALELNHGDNMGHPRKHLVTSHINKVDVTAAISELVLKGNDRLGHSRFTDAQTSDQLFGRLGFMLLEEPHRRPYFEKKLREAIRVSVATALGVTPRDRYSTKNPARKGDYNVFGARWKESDVDYNNLREEDDYSMADDDSMMDDDDDDDSMMDDDENETDDGSHSHHSSRHSSRHSSHHSAPQVAKSPSVVSPVFPGAYPSASFAGAQVAEQPVIHAPQPSAPINLPSPSMQPSTNQQVGSSVHRLPRPFFSTAASPEPAYHGPGFPGSTPPSNHQDVPMSPAHINDAEYVGSPDFIHWASLSAQYELPVAESQIASGSGSSNATQAAFNNAAVFSPRATPTSESEVESLLGHGLQLGSEVGSPAHGNVQHAMQFQIAQDPAGIPLPFSPAASHASQEALAWELGYAVGSPEDWAQLLTMDVTGMMFQMADLNVQ